MSKPFGILESVARNERKNVWRDRVVAGLFALGMIINVSVLENNARMAMDASHHVDHAVAVVDAALASLPA